MLKKIYLSPLGYILSLLMNIFSLIQKPFMVYGFYNRATNKFQKNTRVSSTVKFLCKENLDIGNNVWIWHHSIIDSSNKVKIGEGSQIGAWVGIFTHSSHVSIRLLGKKYIEYDQRVGYVSNPVEIGKFVFIAAGSIILPGVKIGDGVIVSSNSVVSKDIPANSIVSGNPARVIGSVVNIDKKFFDNKMIKETYFDKNLLESYNSKSDINE